MIAVYTLKDHFLSIREKTQEICSFLEAEDYLLQPDVFTSPAKWHLAHSTWFFEEFILTKYLPSYKIFDEKYRYLFNSYYNNVGERVARENRAQITRPTVNQVFNYRDYVNRGIIQLLDSEVMSKPIEELLKIGLNHEQQHQELLITDVKYALAKNPYDTVYKEKGALIHSYNNNNRFVYINEGVYEVGYNGRGFCYDNEKGNHKVYLNAFEISTSLVTNGEYIKFINDNGYLDFNLWLDEGWYWINKEKINAPLYWKKINNEWYNFTLEGLKKINPDDILCHISFYEAQAFATWKKMRLPTEFEWEVASHVLEWGKRWEWTNSAYLPYPDYKKDDGAIGEYNSKFMINQMVLRGASVATAQNHSRNTYRNFFHPNMQWQFSGIRLVK